MAQDLGSSPELIGLIVAASTITGIFIKLPAGALSDILGRRRMMLLGALFFAGPPFLYPFVTDPISLLLLLRFLHGFATAIFSPVASSYMADIFQEGRGEKLGWFASASDVEATMGPIIGGFILFYTTSYPTSYLIMGGLGLLPFLMFLRLSAALQPRRPTTGKGRASEPSSGSGSGGLGCSLLHHPR